MFMLESDQMTNMEKPLTNDDRSVESCFGSFDMMEEFEVKDVMKKTIMVLLLPVCALVMAITKLNRKKEK